MADICEVEFAYSYVVREEAKQLVLPIKIPFDGKINELVARVIKQHDIPCYFENELTEQLTSFIREETSKWRDKISDDTILYAFEEKIVNKCITEWVKKYTGNHSHFTTLKESPKNEFPIIYHQLIHSPALNTLLQLEHTYSMAMNEMWIASKNAVSVMQKKHDGELETMMKLLGTQQKTDHDVNKLMRQQVTERKNLEDKWSAEVTNQQESQKKEYTSWLERLYKDMKDTSSRNVNKGKKTALSELESRNSNLPLDDDGLIDTQPLMEESFTVHLGAQQKSSHNLRLLCVGVLSFFSESADGKGSVSTRRMNPCRIETAMSLYTNDLTAIVLMTEREINTITGIKEVFGDICRQSTDFHFLPIDAQLSSIQEQAYQVKLMRQFATKNDSAKVSPVKEVENQLHPPGHSSDIAKTSRPTSPLPPDEEGVTLEPGDFYVTKHSNLSKIQVVCHLISEEKAILDVSLSNRHAIMQGLRNILRVISKHGLHQVVLPLLLTNQMKPEMTINWCIRRAELVFKSVKGFLLENTTWKGDQTWTVQFLLPQGISEELFEQISELLSKTFRTSVTRTLT